jgi:hypothetical protein
MKYTFKNNKDLTPDLGGQFDPANNDQGPLLFNPGYLSFIYKYISYLYLMQQLIQFAIHNGQQHG